MYTGCPTKPEKCIISVINKHIEWKMCTYYIIEVITYYIIEKI